jgi:hypothetical protein
MSAIHLPWFGADDIARLLSPRAATAAIREALRAGLDSASDPARGVVDLRSGQLLLMPSQTQSFGGVKVATVATCYWAGRATRLPRRRRALPGRCLGAATRLWAVRFAASWKPARSWARSTGPPASSPSSSAAGQVTR